MSVQTKVLLGGRQSGCFPNEERRSMYSAVHKDRRYVCKTRVCITAKSFSENSYNGKLLK